MFALNRILVPTNLGEPSKAAIRYGVAFARQFNAKLYIVHIHTQEDYESAIETERVIEELLPEAAPAGSAVDGTAQSLARNAAKEELAALLSAEEEQATQAELIIRPSNTGNPGDAIVDCAKEFDVELVVIGAHRQGFVEHLLARSVKRKVVRNAPCPVLIVHYPQHDFVVQDDPAN